MNWRPVARHEAGVLRSTRSFRYLLGALVATVLLSAYVYPVIGTPPYSTARFTGFLAGSLTGLLAFVGVLVGYGAVAGDRESGALRLSLSLPRSRLDVAVGTFLGRAGVLAGVLVAAMAGAGVLVVYPYGQLVVGPFLAFVGVAILYGSLWTGIGLAVSMAVATKRRALIVAFGLVLLLAVAWEPAVGLLEYGLTRAGLGTDGLPRTLKMLIGLVPGAAFERVVTSLLDPGAPPSGPSALGGVTSLGVLALWTIGPLGAGYWRFARSDLA